MKEEKLEKLFTAIGYALFNIKLDVVGFTAAKEWYDKFLEILNEKE